MALTIYMAYNPLFGTIIFVLSESSNKTLFKNLNENIIKVQVAENEVFSIFFATLTSIISRIKSLNKVFLDYSYRPQRNVQMNVLHAVYSVIVIEIIDAKIVYAIYLTVFTLQQK